MKAKILTLTYSVLMKSISDSFYERQTLSKNSLIKTNRQSLNDILNSPFIRDKTSSNSLSLND